MKGQVASRAGFIDGASTLLMRSSNSALLEKVTDGLHQQWDLTVPGSVQSQEAPLPQVILSCKSYSRAKVEPSWTPEGPATLSLQHCFGEGRGRGAL